MRLYKKFRTAALLFVMPFLLNAEVSAAYQTDRLAGSSPSDPQHKLNNDKQLSSLKIADFDDAMAAALIHEFDKKYDDAAAEYHKAIRTRPKNLAARVFLILMLLDAKKGAEASIEINASIKLKPDAPYLYLLAGQALEMQGKSKAAREQYSEVIRMDPKGYGEVATEKIKNMAP